MKKPAYVVLAFLALAFAAPAPWSPALVHAAECSPIPHVVHVECLDVPPGGAVALWNVGGTLDSTATPGLSCSAIATAGNTASVTCVPSMGGSGLCVTPLAFGMVDDVVGTVTATADCGGLVSASCQTGAYPATFCFNKGVGVGTQPFTCTAEVPLGYTLTSYTWWVQCSQPT